MIASVEREVSQQSLLHGSLLLSVRSRVYEKLQAENEEISDIRH